MPRYLFHGSYTPSGIAGVIKEGGSARVKVVENLAKGLGGRLETFDFAFGKDDFYTIVELPDNASAAAVAMTVAAAGGAGISTTVLMTAAEVDAAAKKHVDYRKPGS